jgi:hypothetical protein
MDGRHQAISQPGPPLIPAAGSFPRPAGRPATAARECGRLRPGSARRSYRTAAPAIRTIRHGSGQSSQNPSYASRETADGFLPGRIRVALRDGLNMHKAVNFWQLIAGRLLRYRIPCRPRARPAATSPSPGHVRRGRTRLPLGGTGRDSREDAPRDYIAGFRRELGGTPAVMADP